MNVKCIEAGSFSAITVGTEYAVIDSNDWSYIIRNNSGIRGRYAKKYFSEVAQEVPKKEPEKPKIDISKITIKTGDSEGEYYVDIIVDTIAKARLTGGEVTGNCGILFLYGIENLYGIIKDSLDSIGINGAESDTCFANCVKKVLEYHANLFGIVSFSASERIMSLWKVMDEIDHWKTETEPIENPNSGNKIKMWLFYGEPTDDGDED